MKNPLISIIISTHNRSSILKESLKNIPNVPKIEVIVVENGSDDFEKLKYKEIKLKNNATLLLEDIGNLPRSRNVGINNAKGEYIFLIDDDDEISPEFIYWLLNAEITKEVYRFKYFRMNEEKYSYPIWSRKIRKKSIYCTHEVSSYLIKKNFILKIILNLMKNSIMEKICFLDFKYLKHLQNRTISIYLQ